MLAGVSSLLPYTHTGIAPYNRMAHDRTGVYIVLFHQSGAMDDVIPIQRRSLEDLFYYLSKVISAQIRPSQPTSKPISILKISSSKNQWTKGDVVRRGEISPTLSGQPLWVEHVV